jgi:type I restriction enzyme S subunit
MTPALPAGWEVRRLDEVADVRLGRQRSPKNHQGLQMRSYLRAANVGWAGLLLDDVKQMNFTEQEMGLYRLAPNDIVLSEASGSPEEVGKSAIWSGELSDCAFQNTLLRVRSHGPEPKYLLHFLRHLALSRAFARRSRGVGIHHIGRAALASWPVPIPPVGEQRRIVEILEDHLSRLDAAERALERVLRRLTLLASGERHRVFTRLRNEHGTTPLLDVAAIANGQTPKGVLDVVASEAAPGLLPFFKVGDMNTGDGRWMDVARSYIAPDIAASIGLVARPAGTVLLPKRGGAIATNKKRILRRSGCYDLNTMGIIPSDRLEPLYLWHWLITIDLATIADGSNVPQINAPQVRALALPLPALDEQCAVVSELDQLDQAVGATTSAAVTGLRRGQQLRRSLLAAAFVGRLNRAANTAVSEELVNV